MIERNIDKVQNDVMNTLKGCGLTPNQVLNIMLSLSYSMASEINNEPIQEINKHLEEIQYWQNKDRT